MAIEAVSSRNEILRRLGREDYERLRPQLQEVSLSVKQLIYEQGRKIDYVYFPESGVISVVKVLANGTTIETSTVGNEGLVGLPAVFGIDRSSARVFCQIPGRALRLKGNIVLAERRRDGLFAELLLRFAHATLTMLSQSVACNRCHALEERMCRWLLMTRDRVGADSFPLTQEFLGQMLGVRRPTVNLASTALQRDGLIRYRRGKITIVNRVALEESSCECYAQMRSEMARSLGRTPRIRKAQR